MRGEGTRLSVGLPSLLVGAVFMAVHLAFQIFALLQAYLSGSLGISVLGESDNHRHLPPCPPLGAPPPPLENP